MVFAVEGHVPHQPGATRHGFVRWCGGCAAIVLGLQHTCVSEQHEAQQGLPQRPATSSQSPDSRPLPAASEEQQGRGRRPPPASSGGAHTATASPDCSSRP